MKTLPASLSKALTLWPFTERLWFLETNTVVVELLVRGWPRSTTLGFSDSFSWHDFSEGRLHRISSALNPSPQSGCPWGILLKPLLWQPWRNLSFSSSRKKFFLLDFVGGEVGPALSCSSLEWKRHLSFMSNRHRGFCKSFGLSEIACSKS